MATKGTTKPQFAGESAMRPSSNMNLEVTVVSAEEVRLATGRTLRRGAYAVVHAASSPPARTHVDEEEDCNGYPYWREAVRVTLPAGAPAIVVEICCGRGESVAAALVPVGDFSVGPPGHLHCLSYRLLDSRSNSRNGIVNIAVKRLDGQGKAPASSSEGKAPVPSDGKSVDAGASSSCCGVPEEGKLPGAPPAGMVMGFPVFGLPATGHAYGKCTA